MTKKISWGVLSTAKIGTEKVIPAMQNGKYSQISAIASRDIAKAQKTAETLGIPKAYGSYEALLKDREIEAIYIPLPNHLHVEWTVKSLEAGKHILCEKPIGLNFEQAEYLRKKIPKFPELKIMEAFMYRFHPQWQTVKQLIHNRTIGDLKNIHSHFSYYNVDPSNIRNKLEFGGGGLLDIGCYCVSLSRFLFENEPLRVCASIEYDPKMKIDRFVSAIMEFENGTSTFTCSTQLADHKYAEISGTYGRIEIENPFVLLPESKTKIIHNVGPERQEIIFEACNQYTIQGDMFSQAILTCSNVPTPINDAFANMKVIDKIFESSRRETWVEI